VETLRQNKTLAVEESKPTNTNEITKWSWACRLLDNEASTFEVDTRRALIRKPKPVPGDVALFKVSRISSQRYVITNSNKRMRIYVGDLIVGIFGNRYATDAYEGEIDGVRDLSLLTASGVVGTLKSRHRSAGNPTKVSFVGFLKHAAGQRVNLKEIKFKKSRLTNRLRNLVLVIGSGMNSGKTTACRKLTKSFSEMGLRVAACKLTGTASHRDQYEMSAAAAAYTIDFSDYGFPSTYKCEKEELIDLFNTITADISKINPDVTIMEVADGVLQRETNLLLYEPSIRQSVKGVVVTADSAPAALYVVEYLKKMAYNILVVTGAITSSPLYVKEFQRNSDIPIISSAGNNTQMPNILNLTQQTQQHQA
jgi:hypothetical protein